MEDKIMSDDPLGDLVDLVAMPEREADEFTVREIAARLSDNGGAAVDPETVRMRLERLIRKGLMSKRMALADGKYTMVYRKVE